MPLPFLLAGAAVLAGGFGVKKGVDSYSDFNRAKTLNSKAKNIFDDARADLEKTRGEAQKSMETLGKLKFQTYEDSIIPFVEAFSKIKNIEYEDKNELDTGNLPQITHDELDSFQQMALEMKSVVSGGIAALGTGGLAGLAAYGGVGVLGTASTGAAIGGLSGVAATNATLAWLGGGSIAAGGYGMAGGMMVLGGIVAGPVLAVGGMMLASKAEAARHEAYSNLKNAELAAEEMLTAEIVTGGIQMRFDEVSSILHTLKLRFEPLLDSLKRLVDENSDYQSYSDKDKRGVFMSVSLAKTLKNILEAPLLSEDGRLTTESRDVVKLGNELV